MYNGKINKLSYFYQIDFLNTYVIIEISNVFNAESSTDLSAIEIFIEP